MDQYNICKHEVDCSVIPDHDGDLRLRADSPNDTVSLPLGPLQRWSAELNIADSREYRISFFVLAYGDRMHQAYECVLCLPYWVVLYHRRLSDDIPCRQSDRDM